MSFYSELVFEFLYHWKFPFLMLTFEKSKSILLGIKYFNSKRQEYILLPYLIIRLFSTSELLCYSLNLYWIFPTILLIITFYDVWDTVSNIIQSAETKYRKKINLSVLVWLVQFFKKAINVIFYD